MEAKPQRLQIDLKKPQWRYLVHGYIKRCDVEHNLRIPQEIDDIIFDYCYVIVMKFYTKNHGDAVKFVDNQTVQMVDSVSEWSTCLFGYAITSEMCNEFKVEYSWEGTGDYHGCFLMGFSKSKDIDDVRTNWNQELGDGGNKKHTVGILIHSVLRYFRYYDDEQNGLDLTYRASEQFKSGDTFALSFNFVKSECVIYHNNVIVETMKLNSNVVIPGLSMYKLDECVKITKWEFIE